MYHAPIHCSAVVVRVFRPEPDDPNRASGEEEDGSDPPFLTAGAVRRGGSVPPGVPPGVPHPPPSWGSLPSSCIRAGRLPGPHAGRTTSCDASAGWFLLTGGGRSSWCGWHWPAVFSVDDPVAVLVHGHTPNLYRAVVAWQNVAPGAGVSLAGRVMIAASRIRSTRRGGGLPLPRAGRSRLTTTRPRAWYRHDE